MVKRYNLASGPLEEASNGSLVAYADYANLEKDALRYRYLREHAVFDQGPSLRWHLPRVYRDERTVAERLDADIDEHLPAETVKGAQ